MPFKPRTIIGSLVGLAAVAGLFYMAFRDEAVPVDLVAATRDVMRVTVDADGTLRSTGSAGPGRSVDLILHLPCTVAIANTAHPLDPSPHFDTTSLEVLAWQAKSDLDTLLAEVAGTDPEYQRAVANSEDVWAAAHH